jgi:sulfatase modifying factor 1
VRSGKRISWDVGRHSARASRTRFLGVTFALVVSVVTAHEHVGSDLAIERLLVPGPPAHPWTLVAGKYWQIASVESEDPGVTDEAEGNRGACAQGMIEVQGSMKIDSDRGTVEGIQDTTCTDWISREFPERCATFDADRWQTLSKELPVRAEHFCVDRFEYPNRKGAYPLIAVTWREAGALCQDRGARLCTEDEWTFACEGEDALPYPTGYLRDPKACVIDRPWRLFDERLLAVRDSAAAVAEIDYVWQGEASGSRPLCKSPFGLYDTTGNVDEWTRSVQREGYASVFKGGYWGPVRARCRAATRAHNEDFYFYQQGFRCCADVPAPEASH